MLFDPGPEDFTVHRTVDDKRGEQSGAAEGGEEGRGHPVSVRHIFRHAFVRGSPTVDAGHVGFHPRFIQENQTFGIDRQPPLVKLFSFFDDVGAFLLGGFECFF